MFIKRIVSAMAVCALALGMGTAAFADEGKEDSEKKVKVSEGYDAEKLTDEEVPALSFDGKGYEDYIHLTRDAEKAGLSIAQEKDVTYQGNSLKVSASKAVEGYFAMSGAVTDADNKAVYPDAPAEEESDKYSIVGISLYAEDFGLPSFDGCFISFAYRLTDADKTALMDKTVYVYGADENGVRLTDRFTSLTYDDVLNDNVNKFNPMGTYSLPADIGAAQIIFDIPVMRDVKDALLYLDNITIQLPDSAGDLTYVKNMDSYNVKAEKRSGSDEIQVKKQKTDLGTATDSVETDKRTITPAGVTVIVIFSIIFVGGIGFLIVRRLRRFF